MVVVTVLKKEEDGRRIPLDSFLDKWIQDPSNEYIKIVNEDNLGLPIIYNKVLKEVKQDKVIFVHSDMEIHDLFFKEKLNTAFEKFDVVGLAGGRLKDTPDNPREYISHMIHGGINMWNRLGSVPVPGRSDYSNINSEVEGGIWHFIDNKLFYSNFNSKKHYTFKRLHAVDGCLMAVNKKVLEEKDCWFDEDFQFHHYDLSFCMRCNWHNIRIGVWPIFCIHHSGGSYDKAFIESNYKFMDKYKYFKG